MKKVGWGLMSLVSLAVMLLMQFGCAILFSVIYIARYGTVAGSEAYMKDLMLVMTWIDLLILIVFGLWYYLLAFRKNQKVEIRRIKEQLSFKTVGKILILAVGLQGIIQIILNLWNYFDPAQMEEYAQLIEESGITEFSALTVLTVALVGPIGEELIFRGVAMECLKRSEAGFWVINVIQALLFGIAHLNLVQGAYAFLLGLALGWLGMRYETILAPMLLHIFFNAYSVCMDPIFEILEIPDGIYNVCSGLLGALFLVLAFRGIWRETEKKRMLVTGASGFLGKRIVQEYAVRYRILAPSHEKLDLNRPEKVQRFLEKNRPQLVIHCAAVSDTGWCQEHPQESWRINVEGTENLAKACANVGSKLIYCSSDQVYSWNGVSGPHSEEEPVQPVWEYGKQKVEAERRCQEICPDSVGLRLCWMYDRNQMSNREHGNFLIAFFQALREGKAMSYPIHDFRGITDVRLVVEKLEQTFSLPGGIYNFGSESSCSMYETVRQILSAAGISTDRLSPNEAAFAENPRDIRVRMTKAEQFGISFPDTAKRLAEVLREELGRAQA